MKFGMAVNSKFDKMILNLMFYRRHIRGGSNVHNFFVRIDYYKQLKSQFTNFLQNRYP